jgi:hypothetical protein
MGKILGIQIIKVQFLSSPLRSNFEKLKKKHLKNRIKDKKLLTNP